MYREDPFSPTLSSSSPSLCLQNDLGKPNPKNRASILMKGDNQKRPSTSLPTIDGEEFLCFVKRRTKKEWGKKERRRKIKER
ncbi:unnamed protein product [Linum tenue]|uniref:Uncharacterized protein n=1 Tax=Linum tenue TaxID=586396 RepID=A0AAV0P4Q2_9ROSI|nr:unnamed protein product [Linum tenue]